MSNVARRHHYLPQSYLAGFTPSGRKSDRLYVFDLELRKVVGRKAVRSVAFEMEWHTVKCPNLPTDCVEKALGRFEQPVAETISRVALTRDFTQTDLDNLLNFVSLTAVRVPRFREGIRLELQQRTGMAFEEAVTKPSNWSPILKWLPTVDLGWSQKDCERFLMTPHELANAENYYFFATLASQGLLLEQLAKRTWSLFIAGEGQGAFICSDNPVGLIHSPPVPGCPDPSFDETNTVLTLPLTRQSALIGRFTDESVVAEVDSRMVATINFQTLHRVWRYIYGPQSDFPCLSVDGGIAGVRELFSHVKPRDQWEI